MMSPRFSGEAKRMFRVIGILGVVFVASTFVAAIGSSSLSRFLSWTRESSPSEGSLDAEPPSGLEAIKHIPTDSQLPPVFVGLLRHSGHDGESVLVLLDGDDLLGCEDLGRQLRRLRTAAGTRRMVIAAPLFDGTRVNYFVERERIPDVVVEGLPEDDWSRLLSGSIVATTPAAMVVDREGKVVRGVMHTTKVRNVRAISFAEELELAQSLGQPVR